MKMTIMNYYFDDNTTIVLEREIKETKNGFTTTDVRHIRMNFPKSEIGKIMFKSISCSPYLRLMMIDGDKEIMKDKLSKWFLEKGYQIENNEVVEY